ncbi:hypothetical protein VC87395_003391A, partial [Vibrio paracholerae 87395]
MLKLKHNKRLKRD